MQKPKMFIRLALLTSLLLAVYSTSANAYSQYSADGSTGNCATCHGDFRDSPYVSLADGVSWNDDLHDVHRYNMLSSDCATCHTTGGRTPTFLNSSDGGTGLAAISCLGCHGRQEGTDGITGAGLRQHHWVTGAATCSTASCHNPNSTFDSDPGVYTTVGENVLPPYYATPGTGHPNIPTDPCNPGGGEDFAASAIGLDNDGDNAYDQSDTNCQTPTPDINLNPAVLNFGNVSSGSSAMLISAIQNLGNADLNVTAIALCAGTSAEFTWLPAAVPFTVIPGTSQNLDVTYAPVDEGLDKGCLDISSNDPDEATTKLILNKSSSFLLYNPAFIRPKTMTP